MELTEEGRLQLTAGVIVGVIAFQDLVDAFEKKRPELLQWPVVTDVLCGVRSIVVVGLDHVLSVELEGHQRIYEGKVQEGRTAISS